MDNSDIGRFTKVVKDRNETAHSNGNIFYKNRETLDDKINEMLSCVEMIQSKSIPIIEKAYRRFLIESSNPEEREFYDDESQIKEIFVHSNYLSLEDIRIAQNWDVTALSTESNFSEIQSLSNSLKKEYQE